MYFKLMYFLLKVANTTRQQEHVCRQEGTFVVAAAQTTKSPASLVWVPWGN
jgi:hypothetical protein